MFEQEKAELKQAEQGAKEQYEKNREIILDLVGAGKLPAPRRLTRKERRQLDAANVNIFKIRTDDTRPYYAVRDDMVDWIVDNIYKGFNFDEMDDNVCTFFCEYVFGLSYKNDLSAKN